MIKILKASAGSGKTHRLALTYILLLLRSEDPYAHRHILAVTFTNKATAEMKDRILRELDTLSTAPRSSAMYHDIAQQTSFSEERIRSLAEDRLVRILHDYGSMSVMTIDKFFQQTLKAFSREVGQLASYQIELDSQSLVNETVDRILDSITPEDKEILQWMNDNVMDQVLRDQKFHLEDGLYRISAGLRSAGYSAAVEEFGINPDKAFSKENLAAIRAECDAVVKDFVAKVKAAVPGARSHTKESAQKYLDRYVDADERHLMAYPVATLMKNCDDEDFHSLFGKPWEVYSTAMCIRQLTYNLGLAREFRTGFDALLKEKNVLSLDDSNDILHDIIDGSDAPFIYEKTGVWYEHYLLDEFQDTSNIQWSNFEPLLEQSEASGQDNLVVGDVKQCIYRFRDSDWKLLHSRVQEKFPSAEVEPLLQNRRSLPVVVEFNNNFFEYAASRLNGMYDSSVDLESLYGDVRQEAVRTDGPGGMVSVRFCEEDMQMDQVVETVRDVLARGASYRDVTILVRTNIKGGKIAERLVAENIPVISDDSLSIKNSPAVKKIVALLHLMDDPSNPVYTYLARSLDVELPAGYHSLYDLCESVVRELDSSFEGELLYVQSFMDELLEWVGVNGNNLRLFLKYWDAKADKDLSISSPEGADAVRIMTIHKSKGLQSPVVIFPFANDEGKKVLGGWCGLRGAADELPLCSTAVYPVTFSADVTMKTLMKEDYTREQSLNVVDNLNDFYVAATRAEAELHILAAPPSKSALKEMEKDPDSARLSCVAAALYLYCGRADRFFGGPSPLGKRDSSDRSFEELSPLGRPGSDGSAPVASSVCGETSLVSSVPEPKAGNKASASQPFPASFASYALGDRLRISADSSDFFGEDGSVGTEASSRLRGIVLHDILSRVRNASDLDEAVKVSLMDGSMDAAEAASARALLEQRIAAHPQWFDVDPGDVRNEQTLISRYGRELRPDRVVCPSSGDSQEICSPSGASQGTSQSSGAAQWTCPSSGPVLIIDYKFGEHRDSYASQVRSYMKVYRDLGYPDVRGYIWYVPADEVEELRFQP